MGHRCLKYPLAKFAGANGKTEAWIGDRTGHGTSEMINHDVGLEVRRVSGRSSSGWLGRLSAVSQEAG
jgi:hypothetical protein